MVRLKIGSFALLCSFGLLAGCASWDPADAVGDVMRGACRTAENCYATCPDGTPTDPQRPNCNIPVDRDNRTRPRLS